MPGREDIKKNSSVKRMEKNEGGCVTASSVWWLSEIACVCVREVFVKYLWVGEAGQIRSEQKAAETAAVS